MQEKLTDLHLLFKSVQAEGLSIEVAANNPIISVLIKEILSTFGLPLTTDHFEILIGFGRAEDCSDSEIEDTLIRLADAGAFSLTMAKLPH